MRIDTMTNPSQVAFGKDSLDDRGFTMVEMIVAMAIIGVLALLAIPAYNALLDKARNVRAMEEIRSLEKFVNAYSIDKGRLPTVAEFNTEVPATSLNDPWGRPYVYDPNIAGGAGRLDEAGLPLNADYDLYSVGSDGLTDQQIDNTHPNSWDDLVRSGDGGYVGFAKNLILSF